jgi:hypothetical protein
VPIAVLFRRRHDLAAHPWQSAKKDRKESEESARKVPAKSRPIPGRPPPAGTCRGSAGDFGGPFQVPAQGPAELGRPGRSGPLLGLEKDFPRLWVRFTCSCRPVRDSLRKRTAKA